MNDWSAVVFIGVILTLGGMAAVGGSLGESWKIGRRVWDRGEWASIIGGGIGAFIGVMLILFGCGASQPQPTDPVTVEVTVCEPTLGTDGQYLQMAARCREVAFCAVTMPGVEDPETIRARAERYARQLDREYDDYHRAGRAGCYNGPVYREATEFLEVARRNGLFCRGP